MKQIEVSDITASNIQKAKLLQIYNSGVGEGTINSRSSLQIFPQN